jgi:hypothetical protein
VELQLLGGLNKGKRTTGNACTSGTSVVMNNLLDHRHCISSKSKTYHGDQWVHVEALVLGGESMEFIIEGESVLSFKNPQIGGGFASLNDKGKDWDKFKITRDKDSWISRSGEILKEGYIALQAASHPIDFKNIQLLDLCGCMDVNAKNYKSYYIKNNPINCKH